MNKKALDRSESRPGSITISRNALFLLFFFICFLCFCAPASARTVTLPITLNYSLLQTLIINETFPEQGDRSTLVDEGDGCLYLGLSNPNISESDGVTRLEMKVSARAGTPLGTSCFGAMEWQGYLVFYQQPHIAPGTWRLSFETLSTEILGADRQPAKVTKLLWNFIEPKVVAHFDGLSFDLMPPVTDLKNFLLPLFPDDVRDKTTRMLASIRPGDIHVLPDNVRINILADVEEVYDPDMQAVPEYLEGEELDRVIGLWESWDGMLTYLVSTLSREVLTDDERQTLINVLLETRYSFVLEHADRTITHDFVRTQFVAAWKELSPIFKNHLYRNTDTSRVLGYLAFVSSSDALLVFDRLGPTFGLEISRNGLVRLMHMLQADPALLIHRPETDADLQNLFQLNLDTKNNSSILPLPLPTAGEVYLYDRLRSTSLFSGILNIFSPVSAVAGELPSFQEILQWKVPENNIADYIKRVDTVLTSAVEQSVEKNLVPEKYQPLFSRLMPALAWQESCFRQFVVRENKLTYLLSYNQSSVGIMQVNERVWKGIYRRDRLRWDIYYNCVAGGEIAAMYLEKYALRNEKTAQNLDHAAMASLVYALYNGGPSQYRKYLDRRKTGDFYLSDRLFREKYDWMASGNTKMLSKCLTGE